MANKLTSWLKKYIEYQPTETENSILHFMTSLVYCGNVEIHTMPNGEYFVVANNFHCRITDNNVLIIGPNKFVNYDCCASFGVKVRKIVLDAAYNRIDEICNDIDNFVESYVASL